MRIVTSVLVALIAAMGLVQPAAAQDWPQQPIRLIVSFGPGGGADIIGRILAELNAEQTRQAGGS